jgi:hypothetical protein
MSKFAVFNLNDLLYRIAHKYPGGIPALAARMGVSPNVLNKKVDPDLDTHHTTHDNLLTILDFADSEKQYVQALCANNGGVFVPTDHLDGISDMALLETYTELMAKQGEFSKDFNTALRDGKVTKAEVMVIKQRLHEITAAASVLVSRFESLVDE